MKVLLLLFHASLGARPSQVLREIRRVEASSLLEEGSFGASVAAMKVGQHFQVQTDLGWEVASLRTSEPWVLQFQDGEEMTVERPEEVPVKTRQLKLGPSVLVEKKAHAANVTPALLEKRANATPLGDQVKEEEAYLRQQEQEVPSAPKTQEDVEERRAAQDAEPQVSARQLEDFERKAVGKLDAQLQHDETALKTATGEFRDSGAGLQEGLNHLNDGTEHLKAQMPNETLPRLEKIAQDLRGTSQALPAPVEKPLLEEGKAPPGKAKEEDQDSQPPDGGSETNQEDSQGPDGRSETNQEVPDGNEEQVVQDSQPPDGGSETNQEAHAGKEKPVNKAYKDKTSETQDTNQDSQPLDGGSETNQEAHPGKEKPVDMADKDKTSETQDTNQDSQPLDGGSETNQEAHAGKEKPVDKADKDKTSETQDTNQDSQPVDGGSETNQEAHAGKEKPVDKADKDKTSETQDTNQEDQPLENGAETNQEESNLGAEEEQEAELRQAPLVKEVAPKPAEDVQDAADESEEVQAVQGVPMKPVVEDAGPREDLQSSKVPDDDTPEKPQECRAAEVAEYQLVKQGIWKPRVVVAIGSLTQCAELCSNDSKCTRFSFQDGECSISQHGELVETDLCSFAYRKAKVKAKQAPKKLQVSAPQHQAIASRSQPSLGPEEMAERTAGKKKKKVTQEKMEGAYCARTLQKHNAEAVRLQLCELLEKLASLRKEEEVRGEEVHKVDPRYIAEPTLGTDQEQDPDIAKAQAQAWKQADAAEVLRDSSGFLGNLPGAGVVKLKDARQWPNSVERGGAYGELAQRGQPPKAEGTTPGATSDAATSDAATSDAATSDASSQGATEGASKGATGSRILERFLLEPRSATEKALEDAADDTKKMVDTAGTSLDRGPQSSDMVDLRRLIDQLDKKLEEVEKDPDFAAHKVVHAVHRELPVLKSKVDRWSSNPGALLQFGEDRAKRSYRFRPEQFFTAGPVW